MVNAKLSPGKASKRRFMTERNFAQQAFAAAMCVGALAFAQPAFAQAYPGPNDGLAPAARQDRIEDLERQLIEATAENERLQRDLAASQREVGRLQTIVNDLASVRDAVAPVQVAPPSAPPPAPGTSAQQRAQGTLGDLPASAAPAAPAQPTVTAGEAYSRARTLLNNGRLAEAEVALAEFVRDYPNAETIADGRYWHAFTLLARNNYQPAAAGFLDYLNRYPNGPRAPEALVRLGMALGGLERGRDACAAFRDLPRRYPRATQPVRDLAARESRAMACPA